MSADDATPSFQSLAPVIYVEAIEPCLSFWTERLGFEVVAQVDEGERLGFALLVRDGVQVMYQSRESLAKDVPPLADQDLGRGIALYLRVADVDAIERLLDGVEQVIPKRTTFYGSTEVLVREPGGTVVTFAQFAPEA